MKKTLLASLSLALALPLLNVPALHAQVDAASALITAAAGAGGYAIGESFKNQWQGAPYLGAALAPAIANFGYNAFKNKNEEEKLKYYLSGRNYERWIQSQKTWYQSTLDPYTGRPQAFSGLLEMDRGMPTAPNSKINPDIDQVYTIPIKIPAGTYDGTPYTERITEFPKLP
jgi:hypothetical protein